MINQVTVSLSIALVLLPGTSWGQFLNCTEWNKMPALAKASYAQGWMEGIVSAASIVSDDKTVRDRLWPQGHRAGSVRIEIDAVCKNNPKLAVAEAIKNVINEKKAK